MFQYTWAELSQQSADQPLLLIIWLRWLILVNVIPALFFIRQVQARWVLAAVVLMLSINMPLGLMFGFSKVLAIPHLLVWIPLIIYLAHEWRSGHLQDAAIFKAWIMAVMATNLISVVFDIRDAVQFLLGSRDIIKANMADIPYISFAAIIIALIALFIYIRGAEKQSGL